MSPQTGTAQHVGSVDRFLPFLVAWKYAVLLLGGAAVLQVPARRLSLPTRPLIDIALKTAKHFRPRLLNDSERHGESSHSPLCNSARNFCSLLSACKIDLENFRYSTFDRVRAKITGFALTNFKPLVLDGCWFVRELFGGGSRTMIDFLRALLRCLLLGRYLAQVSDPTQGDFGRFRPFLCSYDFDSN